LGILLSCDDLSIGCATIKDIDGFLTDGAMNGVVSQSTYLLKNHGGSVEFNIFFGNKSAWYNRKWMNIEVFEEVIF
jgi:hypothetical protein